MESNKLQTRYDTSLQANNLTGNMETHEKILNKITPDHSYQLAKSKPFNKEILMPTPSNLQLHRPSRPYV